MYTKSVNIDRPEPKSRIYLVGVELEGAWKDFPAGLPKRYGRDGLIRDGSLDAFAAAIGGYNGRYPDTPITKGQPLVGELPSPPLPEADIEAWMRHYWPDYGVSAECGMHVHLSLKNPLLYMRLMEEEYPGTMITYLKKWAERENIPKTSPLWDRLNGNSQYCQHVFFADEQVKNTHKDHDKIRPGHRYTAVNFAYGRETGTAETRVLPMFEDVNVAVRAVKEIISITNRFLVATAKKESKHRTSVVDDAPNPVRHFTVRV